MDIALAAAWYVAFLFSVVLHEAAHAWAALKLGDGTAYRGGQVSLNPIPHFKHEPLGMIVVPVVMFATTGFMMGWASAPYNAFWAQREPRRAAWMALAGPLANLSILVVAAILLKGGIDLGLLEAAHAEDFTTIATTTNPDWSQAATFVSILFSLNLILFVFNMIPVPPLDGGTIVTLFMPSILGRQYLRLVWRPSAMIVGLVAACYLFPKVFPPVHAFVVGLLTG